MIGWSFILYDFGHVQLLSHGGRFANHGIQDEVEFYNVYVLERTITGSRWPFMLKLVKKLQPSLILYSYWNAKLLAHDGGHSCLK